MTPKPTRNRERGRRIAALRKQLYKTQEEAFGEIGVSYRTYQGWESGQHEPQGHNLMRLAEYLGTTPDFLLYGEEQGRPSPPPPPPDLAERLRRIEQRQAEAVEAMRAMEEILQRAQSQQLLTAEQHELIERLLAELTQGRSQSAAQTRRAGRRKAS